MAQKETVPPLTRVHNVAPLGRDARKKTRDMVEKAALKARVGSFERHGSEIDAPLVQPVRTSQMFLSDVDRFRQQSADAELRKARELQRQRHDVLVENKRERNFVREETRWEKMEQQASKPLAPGLKAKRNEPSVPYNLISLGLGAGEEAARLQHAEDRIRYRAAVRTRTLTEKQNNTGFNPITGAPVNYGPAPVPPGPLPAAAAASASAGAGASASSASLARHQR